MSDIAGRTIQLTAADGGTVSAYEAVPSGAPKGGVVVIQEVFGVNGHIRSIADRLAGEGYLAIAPALYDRIRPGAALGYSAEDIKEGMDLRASADRDKVLLDIAAAAKAAATAGRVGAVGFCWGGLLAWLAAGRVPELSASVVYYGGGIGSVAQEAPRCPVLGHFGALDKHIPVPDVEQLAVLYPGQVEIHVYPADHGFNCDERASFDAASAATAWDRTLAFFQTHLRG